MTKPFRTAFLEHLQRSGHTIAEIARRSGVSKDQLNKLKQGKSSSTNVDDAIKVAGAFGMTLEEFLSDPEVTTRSEIVALYNQLSEAERAMLLAAAKGLAAHKDPDSPEFPAATE